MWCVAVGEKRQDIWYIRCWYVFHLLRSDFMFWSHYGSKRLKGQILGSEGQVKREYLTWILYRAAAIEISLSCSDGVCNFSWFTSSAFTIPHDSTVRLSLLSLATSFTNTKEARSREDIHLWRSLATACGASWLGQCPTLLNSMYLCEAVHLILFCSVLIISRPNTGLHHGSHCPKISRTSHCTLDSIEVNPTASRSGNLAGGDHRILANAAWPPLPPVHDSICCISSSS